jgi:hypothetical protein
VGKALRNQLDGDPGVLQHRLALHDVGTQFDIVLLVHLTRSDTQNVVDTTDPALRSILRGTR